MLLLHIHVFHSNATNGHSSGQSWRYVYVCKFWAVGQIFKNEVLLESLDQAKINAVTSEIRSQMQTRVDAEIFVYS